MPPLDCPTHTRLYENGRVVAENFGAGRVPAMLDDHPGAVLWLDLLDPGAGDLEAVGELFGVHPLALEDAGQDHERPKLDRYRDHLLVNLYAVSVTTAAGSVAVDKTEVSAFVTPRALITVRKSPGPTDRLVERWDADAGLAASGGVAFLLYGLLDVVVDGHYEATLRLDAAMDEVEDALLAEGGAPRPVRRHGGELRRATAAVRRAVVPMPEIVARAVRTDGGLVDEALQPYYRDVEDHAKHTVDQIEHLRDRIDGLLQADLAEQGNVLNDVTRKLAAWAAIIAVPTAITGYFGQNVPYWGYERFWGFLLSLGMIVGTATALFLYLKRRGWL